MGAPLITPDTEALKALLAKVEAAKGPDCALDAHILCALLAPDAAYVEQSPINGTWCIYSLPAFLQQPRPRLWETPIEFRNEHRSVTASIDAALALVERVLPRHSAGFQPGIAGRCREHIIAVTPTSAFYVMDAIAPTAPLAILGGLFKALVARSESAALAQGAHHEALDADGGAGHGHDPGGRLPATDRGAGDG